MNTTELVLPIVHGNGSGRESLIQLRCNFASSLHLALDSLSQMAPNGRDYYPVPGLFERAVAQHKERVGILANLLRDIEAEALALDEAP